MNEDQAPLCPQHRIPVTRKGIQDIWHEGGNLVPTQRYLCRPPGEKPHTLTKPVFLTPSAPVPTKSRVAAKKRRRSSDSDSMARGPNLKGWG